MVYDAGRMGRARRREPPRPPGRKVIRPLPPAESASQRRERAERLRADAVATRRSVPPRPPAAQPRPDLDVPKLSSTVGELSETSPGGMDRPRPVKPGAASPAGRELTRHGAQAVLDYSDPDALRRAILHYEILGKPLSLRDPFGRFATF